MSPPAPPRPARRFAWALLAAVALLGVLIYAPARGFGFLNLDDDLFVRDNPWLAMGWHWPSLRWALTANLTEFSRSAEYWAPLTLLSRLAEAQVFGTNAGAFHLVSVGLHLLNAVLLTLALRQFTGQAMRSAAVGLLFLVHPLNVEPVSWLSARKDVLSGTFFFLTLLAWGWYVRRQIAGRYALALLAFLGCLMAKPMGVTVPFLLLILDWCPLRRWPASPGRGREHLRLLAEKLPFFLLSGLAAALAVRSQQDWGALQGSAIFSLPLRVENALVSYARYFRRIFWPSDLAIFYPHPGPTISTLAVAGAAAFLVGATVLAWRLRRRAPVVLAGWLWFGLVLGPVIGLVQIGGQAMADRYMYLALPGPLCALVWCGSAFSRHRLPIVAFAAALVLSTVTAARQALTWRNNETVFTQAIAVTNDNAIAHLNLGCALLDDQHPHEALPHLQQAVAICPGSSLAWNDLGRAQLELRDENAARHSYARALALNRDNRQSLLFYGRLLKKGGDLSNAEIVFSHLREIAPELPQPWLELGALYDDTGRWKLAAEAWAGYRRVNPGDPETRLRIEKDEAQLALAR